MAANPWKVDWRREPMFKGWRATGWSGAEWTIWQGSLWKEWHIEARGDEVLCVLDIKSARERRDKNTYTGPLHDELIAVIAEVERLS